MKAKTLKSKTRIKVKEDALNTLLVIIGLNIISTCLLVGSIMEIYAFQMLFSLSILIGIIPYTRLWKKLFETKKRYEELRSEKR